MKKLTWPALAIGVTIIAVGTWGSTVYATAQDAKIRVVTAGAAKAVPVEKPKSVAANTLNIEIVKDDDKATEKKGELTEKRLPPSGSGIRDYSPRYFARISSYFPFSLMLARPALNLSTISCFSGLKIAMP